MKYLLRFTLLALLMLCMPFSLFACGDGKTPPPDRPDDQPPVQDPDQSPDETPDPQPDTPPVVEPAPERTDFRVLLAGDIHNNSYLNWYGVSNEDRMELFVEAVWAEHEEQPIDLLLFLGDYSLDFWINGGSIIKESKSFTADFVENIASRLPEDIEVFFLPGNHEQYGADTWEDITDNERSGVVVLGDNVFLMLDNFAGNLDPTAHGDGTYTGLDMDFIEDALYEYPDADFYLCAHYFNRSVDGAKLQELCDNYDNIVGFFMGHDHRTNVIELGEDYNNKTIAQVGNFAYGKGGKDDTENFFWGFRDLLITAEGATSRYIVAEADANIGGKTVHNDRRLISQVVYLPTLAFPADEPDTTVTESTPAPEFKALNERWSTLSIAATDIPASGTVVLFTDGLYGYDLSRASALKFDITFLADADLFRLSGKSQFELTSSGNSDLDESNWDISAYLKGVGTVSAGQTVTLTLPMAELAPETKPGSQDLDLTNVNFARWYWKNAGVDLTLEASNFRFE